MSEVTYWHKWTPNGSLAYYDRADLLNEEVDEEVGTHYYLATPSVKDAAMH